jgi:hypothetical protein
MAERDVKKLRRSIQQDLAQLNYDLNLIVGKFFNSVQANLKKYDKYIGDTNALVPGIDTFKIVIDLAEELYSDDKAFTENMKSRKQQVVIIRQACYLIGNELGLSYSHMVRVVNSMHNEKVTHHATMLHGANKTRTALEIRDKSVLPIWSNLMAKMQERNYTKTFVSLEPIDEL